MPAIPDHNTTLVLPFSLISRKHQTIAQTVKVTISKEEIPTKRNVKISPPFK